MSSRLVFRSFKSLRKLSLKPTATPAGPIQASIGRKQLNVRTPLPKEQVACLGFFAPTIERVLDLRNFQDHVPKRTITEDFHLTADGIQPPSWRVKEEAKVPMLPEMCELIGALLELAEVSFFHGLMDNLDNPPGQFGYQLIEIPEDQQDKECPIRFRCELRFADQNQAGEPPVS